MSQGEIFLNRDRNFQVVSFKKSFKYQFRVKIACSIEIFAFLKQSLIQRFIMNNKYLPFQYGKKNLNTVRTKIFKSRFLFRRVVDYEENFKRKVKYSLLKKVEKTS